MRNREIKPVTITESNTQGIGYVKEFKETVAQHEAILKTSLELMQKAQELKGGESITKNGVTVKYIGERTLQFSKSSKISTSIYFQVNVGEHSFFVKKSIATPHSGLEEFKGAIELKETLKEAGLTNVDVPEFQLGYKGSNDEDYFVAKFIDFSDYQPIEEYIRSLYVDSSLATQRQRLQIRTEKIIMCLEQKEHVDAPGKGWMDYHSFNRKNIFYNPKTERWLLIDTARFPDREPQQS